MWGPWRPQGDLSEMNIFIVCSKHFYSRIPPIQADLELAGHRVTLPNSFDAPLMEEEMRKKGAVEHAAWKATMILSQAQKVADNDAILVLNFNKGGRPNYIGGATFSEVYEAFKQGKKIFFFNPLPEEPVFRDELLAFAPAILDQDLSLIS